MKKYMIHLIVISSLALIAYTTNNIKESSASLIPEESTLSVSNESVTSESNTDAQLNNWPEPSTAAFEPDLTQDVIEIKENLFIAQTNDIYINTEDYLGKTIKYEGIFDSYRLNETDTTLYYVIRYGPGCCGFDANAGFEVVWDGEYPQKNDWVEAIGVLETYEEDGYEYLRLRLTSLKKLEQRGEEYVST